MEELLDGAPLLGEMTGFMMGRNKMAGEFNKRREIQQRSFEHKSMFTEQNLFFTQKKLYFALEFSCYLNCLRPPDSVYCEIS
jgi:hypothetical protein